MDGNDEKSSKNTDLFHLINCDGNKKRRFKTSKDQATDDGVTEDTAPGTGPARPVKHKGRMESYNTPGPTLHLKSHVWSAFELVATRLMFPQGGKNATL